MAGLDPLFTDLDANQVSESLRRALQIKGTNAAPGKMNIQQLQPVVDVLQDGFAIYEILNLEIVESASGTGQNVDIFNSQFPITKTDTRQNNREFEIRILFMEIQALDITAADGFSDDDRLVMNVRMEMNGFGAAIDGIRSLGVSILKRWKANLAPDDFIWSLPAWSGQGGGPSASGSDESIGVNNWMGWIPANTNFSVRVDTPDNNFGAGSQIKVRIQAIRVPKGCRLPN